MFSGWWRMVVFPIVRGKRKNGDSFLQGRAGFCIMLRQKKRRPDNKAGRRFFEAT